MFSFHVLELFYFQADFFSVRFIEQIFFFFFVLEPLSFQADFSVRFLSVKFLELVLFVLFYVLEPLSFQTDSIY